MYLVVCTRYVLTFAHSFGTEVVCMSSSSTATTRQTKIIIIADVTRLGLGIAYEYSSIYLFYHASCFVPYPRDARPEGCAQHIRESDCNRRPARFLP